ncbi:SDR family NAD(P)-dependent oxidoreductase [Leptolyngbya sp. 7M]|uniref:SDR family NAD(P)-dependent oxidoreductase n=1 Tax=Leptolyngbya sp. 7M TaxID=2812896 RepID=UPI001B8C296C|nr:SDR family NAD(P)-dependent oxidoreductase [Leptolyngbya sp. 7M]QYO65723.1 SDR family NAD(P)-dependent oxidoreductase [Leptolyngbya sp. 7M]
MSIGSIHAFSEKVALVTDASDPVGRAIAIQLALNGAYLLLGIASAKEDRVAAVKDLEEMGTLVNSFEWEPDVVGSAAELVRRSFKPFERLDLLVNTLMVDVSKADDLLSGRSSKMTIEKVLGSMIEATECAIPRMEERPKPRIVSVCRRRQAPDTVSQTILGATAGFIGGLAHDLPDHFRVNAVSFSDQPGTAPDNVARTVLFLLSGEAAGVNGQTIDLI